MDGKMEKTCPKCGGKGTIVDDGKIDDNKKGLFKILFMVTIVILISVTVVLIIHFSGYTFYDVQMIVTEIVSFLVPVFIFMIVAHIIATILVGDG